MASIARPLAVITVFSHFHGSFAEVRNMAFKNEQDLSLYDLASSKTSDAQRLMGEARELLQQDLENVRQEKLAFEEMTKP